MKRTLILLISTIFLLAACNNGQKDNQSNKDQSESKDSKIQTKLNKLQLTKMFKVIITERFYLLRKVRLEVYCKIIWPIAITVKTLKVAY